MLLNGEKNQERMGHFKCFLMENDELKHNKAINMVVFIVLTGNQWENVNIFTQQRSQGMAQNGPRLQLANRRAIAS